MRAAVITEPGGPEVLTLEDRPDPIPGAFDLLVRAEASALNRADLLQRRGLYPAPAGAPADIPGLEMAGVVEACGPHVRRFTPGDRVMAVVGGGACADKVILHEREAIAVPDGLSPTDAAAIPEAFLTAFDAAVLQGGLTTGEWLVVTAVASGVGTAAIQIAKLMGAKSIGSSRTESKLARARALGLDVGVHGNAAELRAAVKVATGGQGAAVALDLVGGPGLADVLESLRTQGSAILVGLMGGRAADVPLGVVLRGRLRLQGTVLRSRPIEQKIAAVRAFERQLGPHFGGEQPRLVPVVDRVMPLAAIGEAHRVLESNATFGKIVLDHRV